jgi:hypothetical protein
MITDPTKMLFSVRENLPKIYINSSQDIVVPTSGGPPITYDPTVITHNLGYVPTARVFYEPTPGEVWPLNDKINTIFGRYYLTSTTLVVEMANLGAPAAVKIYYRIYLDE